MSRLFAPGQLSADHEANLAELERLLAVDPPPRIGAYDKEDTQQRLLRFLRADKFDPELAVARIREHNTWWREYGMETFQPEDEFDEAGPIFACGHDLWGQPTLVARPVRFAPGNSESRERLLRRCVFTVQRCVERLPPGREQLAIVYDFGGVTLLNFDTAFVRELITVFGRYFPERMLHLSIINNGWLATSLWRSVSPFMDPVTRNKVLVCGSDFRKALLSFLPPDHPYLCYALEAQRCASQGAPAPTLPRALPYQPRWQEAVGFDKRALALDAS